ncbi:MAG: hypothetical protein H6621_00110 [Halobacteriovoraceae bacterium]|nr:hypothetical protein [Halobacteriovoraceae bacterium]MCB9093443.1 hypothetical protein [Halobacteriovoraceae bacterium]
MKKGNNKSSQGLEKVGLAICDLALSFFVVCGCGLKKVKFKKFDTWAYLLIVLFLFLSLAYSNLPFLNLTSWIVGGHLSPFAQRLLSSVSPWIYVLLFVAAISLPPLFFMGIKEFYLRRKFQTALDELGLKTASGKKPKVHKVIEFQKHKTKLVINSKGVGLDKYETKRADMTTAFGQIIEKISPCRDKKYVELLLCENDLPTKVTFKSMYPLIKKPYSFVVGDSLSGPITHSIRDLPHLLVAGTTGGGKSNFFRQAIVGLLKSSPHLQVYLLDLKRGIEVAEFSELPNVRIASNEMEAKLVLEKVLSEMDRRFDYLKEKKSKLIDPVGDNKDLIVVGIDEASELYGKESSNEARKELVKAARELTDRLAKLARAAGIHLILSTQKPVKEAIDTKVLENLPARMAFKMVSSAGSNVALGNNSAKGLPAIKGRGIWLFGSDSEEVQTPFIDEKQTDEELKAIMAEFSNKRRANLQPMIEFNQTVSKDPGKDFQANQVQVVSSEA